MAKITRAHQKEFGLSASATPNFGKFGSLAAGIPQYSKDPAEIQSLAAWLIGWTSATVGTKSPALEDMNSLFLLAFRQIAYILQSGLPEYSADTTYYVGSQCQVAGVGYRSKTNDNLGNNPVSDTNNWENLFSAEIPVKSRCRAWVVFNGVGSATILDAYLITTVTRLSAGVYRVTAPVGMSFANACVIATSGGPVSGQQQNNYATLNDVPSAGYVDIRCDAGNGGALPEDTPYISVMIL